MLVDIVMEFQYSPGLIEKALQYWFPLAILCIQVDGLSLIQNILILSLLESPPLSVSNLNNTGTRGYGSEANILFKKHIF